MLQDNYLQDNAVERERLRSMVAKLTPEDLQQSIGHGWTVAAALAHLAYWDGLVLGWLEEWDAQGIRTASQLSRWRESLRLEDNNDKMLPAWLAMPVEDVRRDVLLTTGALDQALEALDPAFLQTIGATLISRVGNRPWFVDRAAHRREHLDEIERHRDRSDIS
ncbi:MAG: DinB family protein [Dehalococcoidia bacterium]|nr:DinB family protein [Dehalococcoidia bacterium]